MSNSSWKERFARRAGGKARDLVRSGSPAILSLRANPDAGEVNSIAAIELLMRRHVPLRRAKRAIEGALTGSGHDLDVPKVEDAEKLRSELQVAGSLVQVTSVPSRAIDVKVAREKLRTS